MTLRELISLILDNKVVRYFKSYYGFLKRVIKASFFTIITPLAFVAIIIHCFGLTLNSFTAFIFFTQIYIIWGQLEVALRQTHISEINYEPILIIRLESGSSEHIVRLENTGEYPARKVLTVTDIKGDNSWPKSKKLGDLGKNNPKLLLTYINRDNIPNFTEREINVEVVYMNIFGTLNRFTFLKEAGSDVFDTSGLTIKRPGILLNSLEYLFNILGFYKLAKKLEKEK